MTTPPKARLPVTPGEAIKRYEPIRYGWTGAWDYDRDAIKQNDAGDYVKYDDHNAMVSELADKLEAAELILKRVQELNPTARCGIDDHIMDAIMTDVSAFLHSLRPTPQTTSEG